MIPKEFILFGEKHKVKQVRSLDKGNSLGEFDPKNNTIKVKKPSKSFTQDQTEQAYFHELVHCILDHLGYINQSDDEVFVDRFGKALHQVLKTSVYDNIITENNQTNNNAT